MKQIIKNRNNQKIVVLVEESENPKGLAFVMHGLSGSKDQPHIQAFAETFKEKGFTVVRFDTTNSFGESDGKYEDATITNYYEDLQDVIAWSKTQPWYQEPFYLSGHSLGGIASALYAQKHPHEVKAIAPVSTVVSGELTAIAHGEEYVEHWKSTGWRIEPSISNPGVMKRLKWSHMEDRLKYDLLPNAYKLTMPVLLIVGEKDNITLPEHQQMLLDKIPGDKELHIIKDAPHTFREPKELTEIKEIMHKWIDKTL